MGPKVPVKATGLFDDEDDMFAETDAPVKTTAPIVRNVKLPNLQEMATQSEVTKPEASEEKPWLQLGLIVKCLNGSLSNGKYMQKIGIVQKLVEDGWGAQVQMIDSQDILVLDEEDCGTTLPMAKEPVQIVKGPYLRKRAVYQEPSPDGRDAIVKLTDERGRIVSLPKSHICAFKSR